MVNWEDPAEVRQLLIEYARLVMAIKGENTKDANNALLGAAGSAGIDFSKVEDDPLLDVLWTLQKLSEDMSDFILAFCGDSNRFAIRYDELSRATATYVIETLTKGKSDKPHIALIGALFKLFHCNADR